MNFWGKVFNTILESPLLYPGYFDFEIEKLQIEINKSDRQASIKFIGSEKEESRTWNIRT